MRLEWDTLNGFAILGLAFEFGVGYPKRVCYFGVGFSVLEWDTLNGFAILELVSEFGL